MELFLCRIFEEIRQRRMNVEVGVFRRPGPGISGAVRTAICFSYRAYAIFNILPIKGDGVYWNHQKEKAEIWRNRDDGKRERYSCRGPGLSG